MLNAVVVFYAKCAVIGNKKLNESLVLTQFANVDTFLTLKIKKGKLFNYDLLCVFRTRSRTENQRESLLKC